MNALYLIRQDDGKITITEFLTIIGNLPGAENLKTQNVFRASAEADYFYENDQTIIRLDEDQQLIEITGVGKASIQAVYEIRNRYAHPLRVFDMDYTFDITLTGVTNIEELRRKMDVPM
jgi:hypothetical protein